MTDPSDAPAPTAESDAAALPDPSRTAVAVALRAATGGLPPLSVAVNEHLVAQALETDVGTAGQGASPAEVRDAGRLARALAGVEGDPLAAALLGAWAPEPIAPGILDFIVEQALETTEDLATTSEEAPVALTDDPLAAALQHAMEPPSMAPAVHELLVDQALEDPLEAADDHELVASERLRIALEGGDDSDDARLARALAAALDGAPGAAGSSDDALGTPPWGATEPDRPPANDRPMAAATATANVVQLRRTVAWTAGALSLAAVAALALSFGATRNAAAPTSLAAGPAASREAAAAPLARAANQLDGPRNLGALAAQRSTADLFPHRFERGQTTARVDRIATARTRDLRHNRFARWGLE